MDAGISPEYRARLNRVLDHIDAHLGEELSVATLAEVACFSAILAEPVGCGVQRLRLERAAMQLVNNPRRSVTEIALDVGFGSSATFARAFRKQFGMTASAWRATGRKMGKRESKTGNAMSNPGRDPFAVSAYLEGSSLK